MTLTGQPAMPQDDHNLHNVAPLRQHPLLHAAAPLPQYEDEMELSSYMGVLADNRWLILSIMLSGMLLGLAYAMLAQPVYEATMLIHVEEDQPNNAKNMIGEISAMFDVKAAAISEMELIKSRMVIAKSVDNLGLYIDAQPVYFPVIGRLLARANGKLSEPGLFGYGGYVWGGEKIDIAEFSVPPALHNVTFSVTALDGSRFRVQQPLYGIDFTGRTGDVLTIQLEQGKLVLRVKQIDAAAGARFTLRYLPKLEAIEQVQKSLQVTEIGKQSGLISVTLESEDASAAYSTLAEIGREYLQQNVTRKLEEAEKSLAFLDKQLPDIKQRLENSEAEYYRFRNGNGTIDLTEEAKISLQQAANAKAKRLELLQKRQDLLIGFTPNHPVVKALDLQIAAITAEIGRADAHIRQLPMLERDLLRLNRDLKVNSDLYATLLNSAQQLRLVKAGKVSNVRLIDPPMMPQRPARPNRGKIVGIATAAGLALGLGVALLRRLLNQGIESAATIERMLGARVVYANIPHSRTQEEVDRGGVQPAGQLPLLACVEPGDPAIESLRSFRTLLHSAMAHCRNNIILISGPTKGLGKSFVSANLAAVLAMSGKRVLLLDADLRDGALHRVFGQPPAPGLSEAIAGIQPLDRALHHAPISGLDFLACGNLPPNPSEFLLHPNFRILLQTLAQQYDYVLIDSSPLLEVSDTLVIAADAGAAFVLARAQVTTTDDINESIKRLNLAGCAPQGILFNDLKLRTQPFQGRFLPRLRQLGHTG